MYKGTSMGSTMILEATTNSSRSIVIGQNNATFAAGNRFITVERNSASIAIIANMLIIELYANGLGSIFNNF